MAKLIAFLALVGVGAYFYFGSGEKSSRESTGRPHRYSADNVFYLRSYISIRTSNGLIGLTPGQEVDLDPRAKPVPSRVMVTDGRDTMAVDPGVLTHDMDEADALLASDGQSQNALSASLAETKRVADQSNQAADEALAAGVNGASALVAAQNTVGTYRTRLAEGKTWAGTGSYGGPVYVGVPVASTAAATSRVGSATAPFTPMIPVPRVTTSTSAYTPPRSTTPTTYSGNVTQGILTHGSGVTGQTLNQ
jgi:hypothetical protein